jgi:hypothetical protein
MAAEPRALDQPGECRGGVQQPKRSEVVDAAGIIATALATSEQNAETRSHAGLTDLHIKLLAVKSDIAGDCRPGAVRTQIVTALQPMQVTRKTLSAARALA